MPSFAPNTAARSQPIRPMRCRSLKRIDISLRPPRFGNRYWTLYTPIPPWKYMRDEVDDLKAIEDMLNHWGNLGWELVNVIHAPDTLGTTEGNILAAKK